MRTIREYIRQAYDCNVLNAAMEWDDKHGATEDQWNAFTVLFPGVLAGPPLSGPPAAPEETESPFEPYRGEGWADDLLGPPPAPPRVVHPTMVCTDCGDDELVLSHEPGEEGWYRCYGSCALHRPS